MPMYPFSSADDLSFLLVGDAVLDTVTFARHIVHFGFENGANISWEANLEYMDPDGRMEELKSPWAEQGPCRLQALLGKRVKALERDDWRLTLTFETGERLKLYSNSGPYEAGTIGNGEQLYVF
jgi:hypothetical protein